MRTLLTLCVAAFAGTAQAQQPPPVPQPLDAKALLDKAVVAKGGVAKLSELKAAVWTTRGVASRRSC